MPGSSVHGLLQSRILEWAAVPFSRQSSQPRDWIQFSHIAGGFCTVWATREAQECWSGRLSHLQQIFPTQELYRSLLHCRQILYQLSYQGTSSHSQLPFRGTDPILVFCCCFYFYPTQLHCGLFVFWLYEIFCQSCMVILWELFHM